MNFKKLAITGATAALLLTSVVPALASYNRPHHRSNSNDTTVNNLVLQQNNVATVANTGLNYAGGEKNHNQPNVRFGGFPSNNSGGDITTGNAVAYSAVGNSVSTDLGCGCVSRRGEGGDTSVNNFVGQQNNVLTVANSGLNRTRGGGDINTGGALADALVWNEVNTSIGSAE